MHEVKAEGAHFPTMSDILDKSCEESKAESIVSSLSSEAKRFLKSCSGYEQSPTRFAIESPENCGD